MKKRRDRVDRQKQPQRHSQGGGRTTSTYILLTEDLAVPVPLQRVFAAQAREVIELPGSHSPFAAPPAGLADALAVIVTPKGA